MSDPMEPVEGEEISVWEQRQRVIVDLLKTIRALAIALLIAFTVRAGFDIALTRQLSRVQHGTDTLTFVACDLYDKTGNKPPPKVHCP